MQASDVEDAAAAVVAVESFEGVMAERNESIWWTMLCVAVTDAGRSGQKESTVAYSESIFGRDA